MTEVFAPAFADLLSGMLFGVFYYVAVVASSNGYERGSMSLTSIIVNMSLFVPLLYSCLVLGDTLNLQRIIGIILIVLTMILAVDRDKDAKKASLRWLVVVLCAFAANGITAVIQKEYVLRCGEQNTMVFMSVAYITASVLFFVTALGIKGEKDVRPAHAAPRLWLAAVVSGLGSFGGNALLGYLCNKVNGAVLYPCINGGLCVLCAVLSFLIFKETLSRRKLCAIAIGVTATVLICI